MNTEFDWSTTALLVVDPQVDVLSSESVVWDLLGAQVERRGIVEKLVSLRDEAGVNGIPILYSWLQVTENDYAAWNLRNALQHLMADRQMMLPEKGSRFIPELEPTPTTVLLSPRKGPSPHHSDLVVQLRQRGIDTVIVAGMIANLCVEAHVRTLTDEGFNAIVVGDAIATTDDASLDATLANFGMLATEVVGTQSIVEAFRAAPAIA